MNPVRGASLDHQWARLARLSGDRTAIRFGNLRTRVSKIDGLVEELHYDEAAHAWTVSYRVCQHPLFSVRVSPGSLAAIMPLDELLRAKLLDSPGVPGQIRERIRGAALEAPTAEFKMPLSGARDVSAFASLALFKSRFIAAARG